MNNDKHIIDTANQATGQVALAEAESSPDMPETLVQLQTPYHFEGKDYTEVNLAGRHIGRGDDAGGPAGRRRSGQDGLLHADPLL